MCVVLLYSMLQLEPETEQQASVVEVDTSHLRDRLIGQTLVPINKCVRTVKTVTAGDNEEKTEDLMAEANQR